MDIQKSFKDALQIVQLKELMMVSVAKDMKALNPALTFAVAAAVVAALGSYLFPVSYGMVTYRMDITALLLQGVIGALLSVAALYLGGYLSEHVFHSKLPMQGYIRVIGHAAILNFLGIFPPLAIVSGIWYLVVLCFVLNKVGKLQAGSIILFLLLFAVILGVVGFVVSMIGLSAYGGGMMGSGMMGW